jgi:hypothetical protein
VGARELVELPRVEVHHAGGVELRGIKPDDVVGVVAREEEVPPVRDREPHARVLQDVAVRLPEERRGVDHARAQLDRVDRLDRMGEDRRERVPDTEADAEHAPRRGMENERDVRVHPVVAHGHRPRGAAPVAVPDHALAARVLRHHDRVRHFLAIEEERSEATREALLEERPRDRDGRQRGRGDGDGRPDEPRLARRGGQRERPAEREVREDERNERAPHSERRQEDEADDDRARDRSERVRDVRRRAAPASTKISAMTRDHDVMPPTAPTTAGTRRS